MAAPVACSYSAPNNKAIVAGRGFTPPTFPIATKFRTTDKWLFLDIKKGTPYNWTGGYAETPPKPGVATPSSAYNWGSFGPSYNYVESYTKWAWVNPGGDWVDKTGTPQSTSQPHVVINANAVSSGPSLYSVDITQGVRTSLTSDRWNAYIFKCTGGQRSLASHNHSTYSPPFISVKYSDGTSGVLQCVACVRFVSSSAYTWIGGKDVSLLEGAAVEFERPIKPLVSATLTIVVSQHSAVSATITGFLANPPLNPTTQVQGVSATRVKDLGLSSDPSIIVSHRYQDGSTLADWVIDSTGSNIFTTANWSPDLFGLGAADNSKLPTAYLGTPVGGKWIYKIKTNNVSLVNSSYSGDGFSPVTSGLGALRIITPKSSGTDGASVGGAGSLGSDLWMLFPKIICGTLTETFTRFYFRYHTSFKTLSDTYMYRQGSGYTAQYAETRGKFGPGVHHWTAFGGNNNTGGSNLGWSNRLGYQVVPADVPQGGLLPFTHSQDMLGYNMQWGGLGGRGSVLRPDIWYCIEIRCKLNTWNPAGGSPSDGVMEVFIDGVKVSSQTNWKYRDGPIDYAGSTPPAAGLPPFASMGPIGLLLNNYNGGVLPPDEDMVMFFSAIACGTSYIGPMNLG